MRGPGNLWRGELSTSALSTATATFALTCVRRHRGAALEIPAERLDALIADGRAWIAERILEDGGWGDTPTSPSNPSTTALCWAALQSGPCASAAEGVAIDRARAYLGRFAGSLDAPVLSRAIQRIYGKDKTFSVPILTMCALAGCLGEPGERRAWRAIPTLPYELALFPRAWFRHLGLPVVSYALPALIAMGQTQHHHRPTRLLPWRLLRDRARRPTLDLLAAIQPSSGGFLEAIPLTSFVTMSLATAGSAELAVVDEAVRFLSASVRADGGWPIDIDLATWGTTLSIQALSRAEAALGEPLLGAAERAVLLDELLGQQHLEVHPFTDAAPGGWAWTDLPGGVPDADDTSGALLSLAALGADDPRAVEAAERGIGWLLDLQNRDGGIPTFCRGWGSLPFDRSSQDITAHALRAWQAWRARISPALRRRMERAQARALAYLGRVQRADGSWIPLWFGNQGAPGRANPTYGTSRVLTALAELDVAPAARRRGLAWLLRAQGEDGGWGGDARVPSSLEETALAVEALAACARPASSPELEAARDAGQAHLLRRIDAGELERPAPIGLYFADLWYSEKLYPYVFSLAALAPRQPS